MKIYNFSKVDDNLFRGGAPTPLDVINLCKDYNIKNIISLDEDAGNEIKKICKKLKINHFQIPINHHIDKNDINKIIKLLSKIDSPTYIHCRWGKDRTGMVVAMYRCMNGYDIDEAFEEADKFKFGLGLPQSSINSYMNAVKYVYDKFNNDSNEIQDDIVTQQRDDFYKGFVPPAANPQQSFAPFLDPEVVSTPYASSNSSYASAKNYFLKIIKIATISVENKEKIKEYNRRNKLKKLLLNLLRYIDSEEQISSIEEKEYSFDNPPTSVPQIGQYDNYSGVKGSGPTETGGYAQL